MLFVDVKFANIISAQLPLCKRKSEYLWNFRCVICGDSKTNKLKARGFIYKMKVGLAVKCHKCNYSTNLGSFIKHVDSNLYREYVLENYKESGAPRSSHSKAVDGIPDTFFKTPTVAAAPVNTVLDPLKRIDKLSPTHPAVKYVEKRKIPVEHWSRLYFCTRFKHYVNTIVPNKFSNQQQDHPRLIIPFFNEQGKCIAFQGRAFGKEDPKYLTIKIDDVEKIYGQERLDKTKRVYIVEGPLDSLFIPNCIAVSGSSFSSPAIKSMKANAVVIYDNEPRSPQLTKLIKKTIDDGFSVCLWPDSISFKDINEAVLQGISPEHVLKIIESNTYSGVEAQLHFAMWKKC